MPDKYKATLNKLLENVEKVLFILMKSEIKKQKFEDDVLSILIRINKNLERIVQKESEDSTM